VEEAPSGDFEYGEALIVLKTAEVMSVRGFESLSLRHCGFELNSTRQALMEALRADDLVAAAQHRPTWRVPPRRRRHCRPPFRRPPPA